MSRHHFLRFEALAPVQSPKLTVFTFIAKAADIARIARIERAGRDDDGALQGFQRPQIANHIREIRDVQISQIQDALQAVAFARPAGRAHFHFCVLLG